MKLSNLFKKETKKVIKSNSQTLDKNQLEKVTGGAEESVILKFVVIRPSDTKS